MADLVAMSLDATAAKHLARALDDHRRWCRANGIQLPDALAELALLARSGQERTSCDGTDDLAQDGAMTPLLLTFSEAAELLRVSERHVRRQVDAGQLRAVEVGERRRRIARQDLEAYVAGLRGAPPALIETTDARRLIDAERATQYDGTKASAYRAHLGDPDQHPNDKETRCT